LNSSQLISNFATESDSFGVISCPNAGKIIKEAKKIIEILYFML
jgi:hypothetical protein